jgi:hypothetical protein
MTRFNIARIVLTILSAVLVRTSFLASDYKTMIDIIFSHTLVLLYLGILEVVVIKTGEGLEKDD